MEIVPGLVSVVIATYNRSNVLRLAIETVLWQTYTNWEIVVVGDCCTDDTAEVVASFKAPRVRFYNLRENFGEQSGPNNFGSSAFSVGENGMNNERCTREIVLVSGSSNPA